jgi:hypothetical protein
VPEGGFEVIPSPPGELYAQNPELQDTALQPYDDPANIVAIHSDVAVYPVYSEEDVEFALDEEDEDGYAEIDIGVDGNLYEDLYLDEHAIDVIEADDKAGR